MKLAILALLIFASLGTTHNLIAQEEPGPDIRFERLGIEDGLINSNVSAIVQDNQGYLWFGTVSGLSRYDGYEFREFIYLPFSESSLPHSQIQTMHLDDDGHIWIGTYGSLSRLNPETETFRNYISDPDVENSISDPQIISILRDSRRRLWVGTARGLNLSLDGGDNFTRFQPDPDDPASLGDRTIRAIFEDREGRVWIGHYRGISIWDEGQEGFRNILQEPDNSSGLPGTYVMSITEDSRGRIFAGMWEGYISRYDAESGEFTSWQLPVEGVYQLMFDSRDRLWVASWTGGLFLMDPDTGNFHRYLNEPEDESSLSNDLVYSLLEDSGGILWVGTRGGGINKFDPKRNSFFVYKPGEGPQNVSPGNYTAMYEDHLGNLWLGTHSSGLNLIDRENELVQRYDNEPDNNASLDDNFIRYIYQDLDNQLWILTQSGLNRYDYENDRFIRMGEPFAERIMSSMLQDDQGNYWFGTYNNGVFLTDASFEDFLYFENREGDTGSLSNNLVSKIFQDSQGAIWFGTNGGLNLWNDGKFEHFRYDPQNRNSISGNRINVIFEDSLNQLWIGTNSGGLNLFDRESRGFTHFTTENGLPSNYIAAIVEDDQNRLWISTSRGLVILDPSIKDFVIIDENDGLLSWEMNQAAIKTRDGRLYISAQAGIHRIDSIDYISNFHQPNTVITSVEISGEEIDAFTGREVLLNFQQNFLSFRFAALDFTAPKRNSFQYRLLGLDNQWSEPERRNQAIFTNLRPGRYTFEVRGANNDGIWSPETAEFTFTIQPPWYFSPPAIALQIIFVTLFLFTVFNFFRIRWQLNQQKLEEESRINKVLERKVLERTQALSNARKNAEEAHAAKSRFLANISHDLRTPLNSIIGFSELIRKNKSPELTVQYSKTIYHESSKLLSLINQILDISKIEAGKEEAKLGSFTLRPFIQELTASYRQHAADKGLVFTTEIDSRLPDTIVSDKLALWRILDNLLSNALKFTTVGYIGLYAGHAEGLDGSPHLEFSVRDSGIGIPEEKQRMVFQSFEQVNKSLSREHGGSGLGMAIASHLVKLLGGESISIKSVPGKGSTFSFLLPLRPPIAPADDQDYSDEDRHEELLSGSRILLVEDYKPNQDVIKALLSDSSAEIDLVASGEEAIEKIREGSYSLVIMDLHMPGMDGLEATRIIRGINPDIPVLGLTADVVDESRTECLAAGMNDVIHKPLRQNQLRQAIKRCLEGDGEVLPEAAKDETIPLDHTDPVIDFQALLSEHEQNRDMVLSLVQGFVHAARESNTQMRESLESDNPTELHRLSHSVKGGALNLMAFDISSCASEIENLSKAHIRDEKTFSPEIRDELTGLLDRLDGHILILSRRLDQLQGTQQV